MKSKKIVTFQASSEEIKKWKSEASARGIGFSEYARRSLNRKRQPGLMPTYPTQLAKELTEFGVLLNKVGNLKTKLNGGSVTLRQFSTCLNDMAAILGNLRDRL